MKLLFPKIAEMRFTGSRRNRRSSQRSSFNSAHVEVLENRILLTGNVKAVFTGNDLIIEGDSGDNEIAVVVIEGNLVVQGINGTTINSVTSLVAIAGRSTIPNDLRISMGSGDDVVIIGPGIETGGDVTIDTGEGDDIVTMNADSRPVPTPADHIHAELSISLNGESVEIPSDLGIGPNEIIAFIHTHDDSGLLHIEPLDQPSAEPQKVGDFFDIWRTNAGIPGNNPDAVFSASEILGNVVDDDHVIRMLVNGRPNSEFENYVIRDGDQIEISFENRTDQNSLPALPPVSLVVGNDLTIFTGQGDDTILLTGISVGDDQRIDSGPGQDTVKVADSTIGDNLWIETSQGNDVAAVVGTTVADTGSVSTGLGDDILGVDDFSFETDTGTGQDQTLFFRFNIDILDEIIAAEDRVGELVNPVAVDDSYAVAADEDTLSIDAVNGVLANDLFTIVGEPRLTLLDGSQLDGSLTFNNEDGSFVYIANFGFSGTETFTYSITNVLGGADVGTVEITRDLIAPVAVDDSYSLALDEDSLTVDATNGVLANDLFTLAGEPAIALLDDSQLDGSLTFNNEDGSFVYVSNVGFSGTETFTYSITNVLGGVDVGTVEVIVEGLSLELDLAANDTIQSNGTLLTKNATFQIDGMTAPDAIIEIDREGDGLFDDGTVVADATGFFSIDVTLIHDSTNFGAHTIEVRISSAVSNKTQSVDVNVHLAIGTVVRFNSTQSTFDIELLDVDAPNTVANFLNYVDTGRFENTIIHRSVSDFVIQGGGFTFDDLAIPQITPVVTDAPIQNEFDLADNSNLRGTLSMAQGPDINSGTSQWFVNVADANQFLDNVPHTVFGRVIGTGMEIVDEINDLFTFDIVEIFGEGALTDVPLDGFAPSSLDLVGTVSIDAGSDIVTGTGTAFTTSIQGPGSNIRIDGNLFTIVSIESDTELKIHVLHPTGVSDVQATVEEPPDESSYVIFSDISKILDP